MGGGAGPRRRVVRRLDDPGKMATLQGGLLGPDPGALSPAQQEQLRNFKVGAPPTSASIKVSPPRTRAADREGVREEGRGSLFPDELAEGWGRPQAEPWLPEP